jgi:hypothetical protein
MKTGYRRRIGASEKRDLGRLLASGCGMSDQSKNHAVSRLIAKRAELAGIIATLQKELDQHRADLTHIDGALRVLCVDLDPMSIRPKRHYRRSRYFAHNELTRLCLDALREADGLPIGADRIADQIIAAKGFDIRDAALRAAIRQQAGSVLKRLHRRGIAEPNGKGRGARWRLARSVS